MKETLTLIISAIIGVLLLSLPACAIVYFIFQKLGFEFLSNLSFWQVYGIYWAFHLLIPVTYTSSKK